MKKIVRLTESDLARIVKRVIQEQEETINVGDMYKLKGDTGSHLRFKITSEEGNWFIGTLLGVYGKEFSQGDEGLRAPKVGDPIKIQIDPVVEDEFSFYLPKSFDGEGGGNVRDLIKLN
jgi:hypothetical protein